jgi:hypothetical protein
MNRPPGVADDDVVVFQGGIPQGVNARTIRAEFNYEISAEEHFLYWRAERPMFVRRLEVDASVVSRQLGHRVRFQTFLPDPGSVAIDVSDNRLVTQPNSWLLPGHGVIAIW